MKFKFNIGDKITPNEYFLTEILSDASTHYVFSKAVYCIITMTRASDVVVDVYDKYNKVIYEGWGLYYSWIEPYDPLYKSNIRKK